MWWNPPSPTLVLPVTSSKISSVGMSRQTGTAFAVVNEEEADEIISEAVCSSRAGYRQHGRQRYLITGQRGCQPRAGCHPAPQSSRNRINLDAFDDVDSRHNDGKERGQGEAGILPPRHRQNITVAKM
jgi:hypothetical protein